MKQLLSRKMTNEEVTQEKFLLGLKLGPAIKNLATQKHNHCQYKKKELYFTSFLTEPYTKSKS